MSEQLIRVERQIDAVRRSELGVAHWPVWEKEVSRFPWQYGEQETCLILQGEVIVTPEGGAPVQLLPGDLAVFAAGLRCVWDVRQPLRKHYCFD